MGTRDWRVRAADAGASSSPKKIWRACEEGELDEGEPERGSARARAGGGEGARRAGDERRKGADASGCCCCDPDGRAAVGWRGLCREGRRAVRSGRPGERVGSYASALASWLRVVVGRPVRLGSSSSLLTERERGSTAPGRALGLLLAFPPSPPSGSQPRVRRRGRPSSSVRRLFPPRTTTTRVHACCPSFLLGSLPSSLPPELPPPDGCARGANASRGRSGVKDGGGAGRWSRNWPPGLSAE